MLLKSSLNFIFLFQWNRVIILCVPKKNIEIARTPMFFFNLWKGLNNFKNYEKI